MERSSTKLSHAQAQQNKLRHRVYKFYSTSMQSVTSALFCISMISQLSNKTDTDWPFRFIALSYCTGIGCLSRGNGFLGCSQDLSMLDDTL